MYCINCGAKLLDDSTFCAECGAKIKPLVEIHEPAIVEEHVATEEPATVEESAIAEEPVATEETVVAKEKKPIMNKGKRVIFVAIAIIVAFILLIFMLPCEHQWEDADCNSPKTCSKCGEKEGEALGHNWKAATCFSPEKCSRCQETRGVMSDHQWTDATCSEPRTCSLCSKTEGEALGHTEGEWKVVETDMVLADEVLKKYCLVCEEELDRKRRDIDVLHDTYHFLMTPDEFVERIDSKLSGYSDCTLTAKSGSKDNDFACGFLDKNSSETEGMLLFIGDGEQISKSQKGSICFDGALGRVSDTDHLAEVLLALIETCDPSLSFSEAKDVGLKVLNNESAEKNGIKYLVMPFDEYSFYIGFSLT